MSVSGGRRLTLSDIRRERKELLLCVERGNKDDIHTYTSGHLGPHSFNPIHFHYQHDKPIWQDSKDPELKHSGPSRLQESRAIGANVEEMTDAWYNFSTATTLQEPEDNSSSGSSSSPSWSTSDPYKTRELLDTTELFLVKPSNPKPGPWAPAVEVDQGRYSCTHSYLAGLSHSDQLRLWKQFDRQVVRRQDLITRNCLSGREAAERHEHNLLQELRRVPACRGPCRECLLVFSDVFSDVCDGSPVLGSVLREIKREYDLYLNSVISSQSSLQDMSAFLPFGAFPSETVELEEATRQVSLLEEKARRALEENDRVRKEFEDDQVKAMENQQENAGEQSVFPDVKHSETEISATAHVECKRRQVWRMWKEVEKLQKEIRERMVSTVTTSSLERCILDTKAEIMHLTDSNKRLRSTNKELEKSILKVLHRTEVSEDTKAHVWEKIWTTVNGADYNT